MTSASHACGSMSLSLAVPIREYIAAARWPPRSEPAKSQDFRPRATPRSDLSAALFVRQIRPSSRKRVKAGQWLGDSRWSMAFATLACFDSSARSLRSHCSRSVTSGADWLCVQRGYPDADL